MNKNAPQSIARRTALTGMLFALALALSYLEGLAAPFLGLPPGVKLGLANIVVMFALLYVSPRQAALLVVLKAGFAFLVRGAVAGALSFAGGGLSFLVMLLLTLPKKHSVSIVLLSVTGALCHNMGQLLVVQLIMGRFSLYYAPVLIAAGIAAGILSAAGLRVVLPALQKAGLVKYNEN